MGLYSEVEGTAALDPSDQEALRAFCGQPGKTSRAEFMADVRWAKRVRFGEEFGQVGQASGQASGRATIGNLALWLGLGLGLGLGR